MNMLSSSFKRLAAFLATLSVMTSVMAAPFEAPVETRDLTRRLVTGAPRFVVYQSVIHLSTWPHALRFMTMNTGMLGSMAKLVLPRCLKLRVSTSCTLFCFALLDTELN